MLDLVENKKGGNIIKEYIKLVFEDIYINPSSSLLDYFLLIVIVSLGVSFLSMSVIYFIELTEFVSIKKTVKNFFGVVLSFICFIVFIHGSYLFLEMKIIDRIDNSNIINNDETEYDKPLLTEDVENTEK